MQQHYKDRKSSWKSGSGYAGFFRSYKRIRSQELSLSISNSLVFPVYRQLFPQLRMNYLEIDKAIHRLRF